MPHEAEGPNYETQNIDDSSLKWMQTIEVDNRYQGSRIYTFFEQRSFTAPIILGGLFVLPLPLISIAIKIVMCSYGPGSDLSGVYLFLPVFIMIGVVLGTIASLVGKGVGILLNWLTKTQHAHVIGTAVGSLLAVVLALIIGFFAFAFFMFPDC